MSSDEEAEGPCLSITATPSFKRIPRFMFKRVRNAVVWSSRNNGDEYMSRKTFSRTYNFRRYCCALRWTIRKAQSYIERCRRREKRT
jgi:hypothetical protein